MKMSVAGVSRPVTRAMPPLGQRTHLLAYRRTWRVLAAIGLHHPAQPPGASWSPEDRREFRNLAATLLAVVEAYDEASNSVPEQIFDAVKLSAIVARQCVLQRQLDWWPSKADLTLPVLWGSEWLHSQLKGLQDLTQTERAMLIDAVALVIYACHEALDMDRAGGCPAYDDRRVDRRLSGLDKALNRAGRSTLLTFTGSVAVMSAVDDGASPASGCSAYGPADGCDHVSTPSTSAEEYP
jgi:hypothetical protein